MENLGEGRRTEQRQKSGVGWENERIERRERAEWKTRVERAVDADCYEYASKGGG
jgi:hypothetical protein